MTNAELIKALRVCGDEPYDITKPCKVSPWKLMRDAADALEASQKALDECAKQLADMAAKLPKEGEWIEDEYGYIHCSKCGMEWDEPEHPQTKFCPNCGAKMKGEQE